MGMKPRRGETLGEKLYRYRGVLTIAAVPILLIVMVVLVMPRSMPIGYASGPDTFAGRAESLRKTIPVGTGKEAYSVIIDAGSTGSRVHVYRFVEKDEKLELQSDKFEQLKPGLSSYADNPQKAAESLKPLLEIALQTVPKDLQSSTTLMVGATAGLRLLGSAKADKILEAVQEYLKGFPFKVDPATGVTILDGKEEGGFAWLTLNYLLDHLGKDEGDTIAAIDLGGGSVQQAYALSGSEAKSAPEGYVTQLSGGGRTYDVYVHSYLGYGLMAGRAAVLAYEEAKEANPCVSKDHKGTFEYGGLKHVLMPHPKGSTFETCTRLIDMVLNRDKDCGAPKDQCAFNGAWGGSRRPKAFYISSYFWDRATDAGLIGDEKATTAKLSPKDLKDVGDKACTSPANRLSSVFPKVPESLRPYLCMDLSFQHELLIHGFKIPEDAEVTLVKKIQYRDQQVEAAWPLGAAIHLLSSTM